MTSQVTHSNLDTLPVVTRARARLLPWTLSLGGFVIGTVEFASMSLLPQFTDELGVSIPAGGHYRRAARYDARSQYRLALDLCPRRWFGRAHQRVSADGGRAHGCRSRCRLAT
jgi:hypothetical protein